MEPAAATTGIRATRMSLLRTGQSSWRTWAGATPRYAAETERLRYLRERADASVQCTVLRLMPSTSARNACLTSSGISWADSGRPD